MAAAGRSAEQLRTPACVRAIERRARDERHHRDPHELRFPSDRAQRPVTERRERRGDHRPRQRRTDAQQDRRRERETGEEPADAGKAHQAERQLVARQRGRTATPHPLRDLARVDARGGRERAAAVRALR